MIHIVVAVMGTIVGIVAVAANSGVVIVSGSSPMVTVRTVDVAPAVSIRKGMFTHVIIRIERDV